MSHVSIANKRNFALVGHGGSGKTTLAEALLYATGATTRMGKIQDGNTVSDHHPEEIKRKYSIFTTVIPVDDGGFRLNILDTPGYQDFIGEMIGALYSSDAAVLVINGHAGLESQAEKAWEYCEKLVLPRLIFISQLEKEGADYFRVVGELRSRLGTKVAPLVIPIGEQHGINGVIDVMARKAWFVDGKNARSGEVPSGESDRVEETRQSLLEAIVENDDELMEMYLADEKIPDERLIQAMRAATLAGSLVPCIAGVAEQLIGVHPLLDLVKELLPGPLHRGKIVGLKPDGSGEDSRPIDPGAPFAARVFKVEESPMGSITYFRIFSGKIKAGDQFYNPVRKSSEKISTLLEMTGKNRKDVNEAEAGDIVATVKLKDTHRDDTICDKEHPFLFQPIQYPTPLAFEAIHVESKGDLEKISAGLSAIALEDPTLNFGQDSDTRQMVVRAMGELQLDVARSLVSDKFKVNFTYVEPKIPYRETIRSTASSQGKHKKQTGGRGQYGDVWLELSPLARGEGFKFIDAIVGGVVPGKFIPAVEKGVVETMAGGILAGCQVVDVQVKLFDGSHHSVDSSEMAFKLAAALGFKAAFEKANPVLLEPIYAVKVTVPEAFMGDVMGDLNSRRGRLQGMDSKDGAQVIKANVPLAELYKYVNHLRSMTQGRGSFEMEFSHYEDVPSDVAQKVIEDYKRSKEEG
ncbi:MAG: elongation factor G [bacterium]|jgi:elongation factor G